jgi:signal transduction histidine kinase
VIRVGSTQLEGSDEPEVEGGAVTFRVGSWMGRLVGALSSMPPWIAVTVIVALIALGWLGIHAAGGAGYAPPHWFYIPILVAAARFGIGGAVVAAVVSGIVAGPLLPSDVATGSPQSPSDQIIRGLYFLVIGTLTGAIIWRLMASTAKEAAVARREGELAAHKAAVISCVSHEFRTPLSVLLGSSKTLLQRGDLPELERTLLEGIDGSARRLHGLVAAVLAVAEGPLVAEDPTFTAASARDVLAGVVTGTDPRDAGRLHVDVADEVVETDPPVLEALLRQLVDNALKFSPLSSPVEIAVRRASGDDGLEILVQDRGPGIDDEFLPSAFQPFTQQDGSTTRSSGGVGIGLFVADKLAHHLRCGLELRSRAGGGTEARVSLPISPLRSPGNPSAIGRTR